MIGLGVCRAWPAAMRPAIFVLWLLVGCAPVLSDFQSAKLVGTGNIEVTPSGGATFLTDSGSASADQREYGVQVATGVAERVDMRARYAFVDLPETEHVESANVHALWLGPKVGLLAEHLALDLPVGLAVGKDVNTDASVHWKPTLIATVGVSRFFEWNPSFKLVVPLLEGQDPWWGVNMGFGVGDDRILMLRPEVGVGSYVGSGLRSVAVHVGGGVTLYFGMWNESR